MNKSEMLSLVSFDKLYIPMYSPSQTREEHFWVSSLMASSFQSTALPTPKNHYLIPTIIDSFSLYLISCKQSHGVCAVIMSRLLFHIMHWRSSHVSIHQYVLFPSLFFF